MHTHVHHPRGQRRTSTHSHATYVPSVLHIPRNLRFLLSQKFYTKKGLPCTLDHPKKTNKIQNTTRPADPEEATSSQLQNTKSATTTAQKEGPARNSADSLCFLFMFFSFSVTKFTYLYNFNQLHKKLNLVNNKILLNTTNMQYP